MLDIQFIKDNQQAVADAIKHKGVTANLDELLSLDKQRRALINQLDDLRHQRHQAADTQNATVGKQLKQQIAQLERQLEPIKLAFEQLLYQIPNLPSADTPIGDSEAQNQIIHRYKQPPQFAFPPKPHWEMTHLINEAKAVKISGKRFAFLQGDFVRLQLALIQFGLDVLTDAKTLTRIIKAKKLKVAATPFLPILPPTMMRTDAYLATNRLHLQGESFKLADDDLWLTGSAEHTLCAYLMNETVAMADLPVRLVGYNTAYRREVGSAGKDTRGIIRQHQFDKLEMESFTTDEAGLEEHRFMIAIQEYLMEQLDLPFQTVLKCTFDMGGPNIRGVDIETYMPGQGVYRETNSADYLGDYQARGLQTKFVDKKGVKQFVHTNDATVFCQRHLVAILENNQQANGWIKVPKVLQSYLNGRQYLK